jgi:hypothetical protein
MNNAIHRSIAFHWREHDETVDIFNGSYEPMIQTFKVADLPYFKPIVEVCGFAYQTGTPIRTPAGVLAAQQKRQADHIWKESW